ncbi:hypothetical protein [Chryseobacterium sp. WLY505]|uniref:hypothetical protein n=1 Tax=Chryseobacterium sp. WLY505 TaxID=3068892 RepID=UPI002796D252|nr:hypothetical protein [Chryseobacterium sp. WLY505]MDQ1855748.1 hypothetical protein [Chryseobacterium sp. WLY505]
MTNTEAKLIHGLIKKANRVKAVEISGFFTMLHQEGKCNDDLIKGIEEYIGILSILHKKCEGLSVYKIQKKANPIDPADFAKFTKFHVEITELMKAAKEQMN